MSTGGAAACEPAGAADCVVGRLRRITAQMFNSLSNAEGGVTKDRIADMSQSRLCTMVPLLLIGGSLVNAIIEMRSGAGNGSGGGLNWG